MLVSISMVHFSIHYFHAERNTWQRHCWDWMFTPTFTLCRTRRSTETSNLRTRGLHHQLESKTSRSLFHNIPISDPRTHGHCIRRGRLIIGSVAQPEPTSKSPYAKKQASEFMFADENILACTASAISTNLAERRHHGNDVSMRIAILSTRLLASATPPHRSPNAILTLYFEFVSPRLGLNNHCDYATNPVRSCNEGLLHISQCAVSSIGILKMRFYLYFRARMRYRRWCSHFNVTPQCCQYIWSWKIQRKVECKQSRSYPSETSSRCTSSPHYSATLLSTVSSNQICSAVYPYNYLTELCILSHRIKLYIVHVSLALEWPNTVVFTVFIQGPVSQPNIIKRPSRLSN